MISHRGVGRGGARLQSSFFSFVLPLHWISTHLVLVFSEHLLCASPVLRVQGWSRHVSLPSWKGNYYCRVTRLGQGPRGDMLRLHWPCAFFPCDSSQLGCWSDLWDYVNCSQYHAMSVPSGSFFFTLSLSLLDYRLYEGRSCIFFFASCRNPGA